MTIAVRYEGSSQSLNGAADVDGDIFVIEDIEGMDSMDSDLVINPRYRDGSMFGRGKYPKRELLVKGTGWAPGYIDNGSFRIRQKIENMFSDYLWNERLLYVDMPSPGINVQFKTRPGGKIHFDSPKGNSQTFEIPLTCADPRKYAQAIQIGNMGSTGTFTNFGNFPTYATATLLADTTDAYLQNDSLGQRITLGLAQPAGTVIDFQNRRVYRSGGIVEVALRPRYWWFLQPGANALSSNTSWQLSFRAAYR